MTWEELCEKAKEMGGYYLNHINFKFGDARIWFSKDGGFAVSYFGNQTSCNITIKSDVPYDQMLVIMKALQ